MRKTGGQRRGEFTQNSALLGKVKHWPEKHFTIVSNFKRIKRGLKKECAKELNKFSCTKRQNRGRFL